MKKKSGKNAARAEKRGILMDRNSMARKQLALWVFVAFFLTASFPTSVFGAGMEEGTEDGAKSVIFLIGDGMG
ncbi:MAG: hypothetical protein NUK54_04280 [Methanothrix sp.]|nr:hypothetical protein [Methanothrix sp.]